MGFGFCFGGCDPDEPILILVDGYSTHPATYAIYLQSMFNAMGLGWQAVVYADVAGEDFDLDDYSGAHLMFPVETPEWFADLASGWTPRSGAPKRIVIHGDAFGGEAAPNDYGTGVKDWIDDAAMLIPFAMQIGDDINLSGTLFVDTDPLTAGVAAIDSGPCSEVTGGTRLWYASDGSMDRALAAHETVDGVSWVVTGSPSFLNTSSNEDNNLPFLRNLHTVAV